MEFQVEDEVDTNELIEVDVEDDIPNIDDGVSDDGEGNDDGNIDESATEEVPDASYCTFSGHTDHVYCVAIHPFLPGVVITGGGDDRAFIWKYSNDVSENDGHMDIDNHNISEATEAPMRGTVTSTIELKGHTDTVTNVGFNFNGSLALTGGYDGVVRIWKVETGELVQILEGPEDIEWAQWHNKGNAVVAGSRDGTVWMWLTHNAQCVHVFSGHDGAVSAGCFSKDGKLICTGGEDGSVRQWNPKSGACRHVFGTSSGGHEADVTCMAAGGDDGDLLITGSTDGSVKLYKLSGKRLLHTFIHSSPTDSQGTNNFNMDNTVFTAATEAAMNNHENDHPPQEDDYEAVFGVECVGFALDQFKFVASGGMDKTLKIWDIMNGSLRCTCTHGASVVSLKWHSRLPIVCSAALDSAVRVWDARSGAMLALITGHLDMVTSIEMNPLPSSATLHSSSVDSKSVFLENAPGNATDAIVTASDDGTSKVFLINMVGLLRT